MMDDVSLDNSNTDQTDNNDASQGLDRTSSSSNQQLSELQVVKKEAIELLVPMADKIDEVADRKFLTLMSIARASNNLDILKKAFEVAKAIESENERVQALLDVVSEIDYQTEQA